MSRYAQEFQRSLADPEGFWGDAATDIDWYQAPTVVLDRSRPPFYRWFADGVMNTCFNAVDRHVRDGRGQQPALIYDSPVTGTQRTYTYAELLDEVARFAGVLRGLGVDKGDRVIVYLPMIPEALIAMLACARIGAVHSVVFGGFAAPELATRIDDADAQGDRLGVVRHRGQPGHRVQADPGPRHRPGQPQAGALRDPAAPAGDRGADRRSRPGLGRRGGRRPSRPTACRWRRPTRCTSCTPRAPRPGPRAWCGTTAGTRSRCAGACRPSTTPIPARCSGPPPTWAGWSGTPTSSTRRCWPGAPPCCTRASRSAPRTRARSGGWWPSTRSRRCSPRRPRSARSRRRTRRASSRNHTTCPASSTCSWRASGSTRRPTAGRANCSASRSSTTGGRPRPAGPSWPT